MNLFNKKQKKNNSFLYLYLFGASFFLGYLFLTPYLSIIAFKSAVERRDTETARKYINFPSVRRSLKDQLKETVSKTISRDLQKEPLALFSFILLKPIVNKVVDSTVDATVTPRGLKILFDTGNLSSNNNIEEDHSYTIRSSYSEDSKSKINLYYKSLNCFVLKTDLDEIEEPIKAYWVRQKLFHWRLTSLDLPFEIIANIR